MSGGRTSLAFLGAIAQSCNSDGPQLTHDLYDRHSRSGSPVAGLVGLFLAHFLGTIAFAPIGRAIQAACIHSSSVEREHRNYLPDILE